MKVEIKITDTSVTVDVTGPAFDDEGNPIADMSARVERGLGGSYAGDGSQVEAAIRSAFDALDVATQEAFAKDDEHEHAEPEPVKVCRDVVASMMLKSEVAGFERVLIRSAIAGGNLDTLVHMATALAQERPAEVVRDVRRAVESGEALSLGAPIGGPYRFDADHLRGSRGCGVLVGSEGRIAAFQPDDLGALIERLAFPPMAGGGA